MVKMDLIPSEPPQTQRLQSMAAPPQAQPADSAQAEQTHLQSVSPPLGDHNPMQQSVSPSLGDHNTMQQSVSPSLGDHNPMQQSVSPSLGDHNTMQQSVSPPLGDHNYMQQSVSPSLGDHNPMQQSVSPSLGDHNTMQQSVSPSLGDHNTIQQSVSPPLGDHNPMQQSASPSLGDHNTMQQSVSPPLGDHNTMQQSESPKPGVSPPLGDHNPMQQPGQPSALRRILEGGDMEAIAAECPEIVHTPTYVDIPIPSMNSPGRNRELETCMREMAVTNGRISVARGKLREVIRRMDGERNANMQDREMDGPGGLWLANRAAAENESREKMAELKTAFEEELAGLGRKADELVASFELLLAELLQQQLMRQGECVLEEGAAHARDANNTAGGSVQELVVVDNEVVSKELEEGNAGEFESKQEGSSQEEGADDSLQRRKRVALLEHCGRLEVMEGEVTAQMAAAQRSIAAIQTERDSTLDSLRVVGECAKAMVIMNKELSGRLVSVRAAVSALEREKRSIRDKLVSTREAIARQDELVKLSIGGQTAMAVDKDLDDDMESPSEIERAQEGKGSKEEAMQERNREETEVAPAAKQVDNDIGELEAARNTIRALETEREELQKSQARKTAGLENQLAALQRDKTKLATGLSYLRSNVIALKDQLGAQLAKTNRDNKPSATMKTDFVKNLHSIQSALVFHINATSDRSLQAQQSVEEKTLKRKLSSLGTPVSACMRGARAELSPASKAVARYRAAKVRVAFETTEGETETPPHNSRVQRVQTPGRRVGKSQAKKARFSSDELSSPSFGASSMDDSQSTVELDSPVASGSGD